MKQLDEKETIKLLIESGREVCGHWTKSAIEDSKDEDQMNNQLLILEAASIHFLATLGMNRMLQQNTRPETVLADQLRKFKAELLFILAAKDKGELELHQTGQNLGTTPSGIVTH